MAALLETRVSAFQHICCAPHWDIRLICQSLWPLHALCKSQASTVTQPPVNSFCLKLCNTSLSPLPFSPEKNRLSLKRCLWIQFGCALCCFLKEAMLKCEIPSAMHRPAVQTSTFLFLCWAVFHLQGLKYCCYTDHFRGKTWRGKTKPLPSVVTLHTCACGCCSNRLSRLVHNKIGVIEDWASRALLHVHRSGRWGTR